ncbi:NAD(P)/FAD-dependent oxidoreductase [Kitasatospora sp. SUK 42]|uniref:FAD/NAD(P)-dependent oxidoreductase n=1 Tax=Kitasatospora sp. SUK 42 TaxID=1588882 RepID=UPI0018CB41F0|nr:NAD(P)/FAD-dependent oxidoreductase [Kitasatospora sp. SUK 42]MBV2155750.1 NAD(P)/FAD-dependent oxidoreductase [Kitasatospora sp. SUK 42]
MPTSPSEPLPYDLAVVGAGPAGLAAAVTAAELGLRCVLLDGGHSTGGQYYRHPAPGLGAARPDRLHHGWSVYAGLAERLSAAERAEFRAGHQVWALERTGDGFAVHATRGPEAADRVTLRARTVLLAAGAYERQLPFPGWTLPGVVTAGGAQAMLKAGLVLPGRRIVVAGSGPLLLAAASSLVTAGADVPAVVEATNYLGYARRPGVLAAVPAKLVEGAGHGSALLRHGVRLRPRSAVVEAHGTDRVTAVTVARLDAEWRPLPGTERRIDCDALAVGHGLLPQIDLATELGADTVTGPDGAVALKVDARLRTSVPGLWSAGETNGVGGADLAIAEGELAGHAIAGALPRAALLRRRARLRSFADVMAAAHRPGPGWTGWLRPDTDVCRCEEVPVAKVREAVEELGAGDPRTVKLLTRAGMGWCQGRMCGPAVACLSGSGEPGPDRRPFGCPVPLSQLAAGSAAAAGE